MKSKSWTQVHDVREFLSRTGNRRIREGHTLDGRVAHWPYCIHCGLVALKNDVTRRALKNKCVTWED